MNKVAALGAMLLVLSSLAWRAPAQAQTAEEFYKGKQIRLIVGTAAGQDYDTWARLIARHLTRFLPGNPAFIVENMPGAGHILATNYLFNLAPRDGTAIGMVSRNMTEAAIMRLPNVRFDPGKFNWIGSPELNHRVLFVNAASGFDKVPDLYARELIVGTPGGAQGVSAAPILLKNLLHMRLKIIQGYHSPGDVILAMARREVDGIVQTLGAPEGARRQWIESGQMRVMFNMEHERVAGLEAPTIFEFAKTEQQRQVLAFFSSSMELGRPLMAPPGVPAQRVAQLRGAFDAVVKDTAFLQEAAAMGFEVMPQSGDEIAARVAAAMATPKSVVDEAQRASTGE
ncbi:MAG TPA: tripartite tricarboxylate transporter substrate-binding protein [Xanthobacteraceae bacterium]|jgi:tripartite-type tricarboxylate transporter receptor subunit TctC